MKKNSLLRSKFVCRAASSAVIVFAFVLTVCCYFSFYYNMTSARTIISGRAEWRVPDSEPEETLPFRRDVDRFLQVYFNQTFPDPADKLIFVELELKRFGDYSVDNETDRIIQNVFIADLQSMLEKMKRGSGDLASENASLSAIRKTL